MHRKHFLALLLAVFLLPAVARAQRDLVTERSTLFSGSGNCTLCHGPGTSANVRATGEDVSPPNLWRSTMMAQATRDPFWQAMVRSEALDHPALQAVIEDKCTNCHAPMGHEQSHQQGATSFSLADALAAPLGQDGVSCTLCHQVEQANFGTAASFSGGYEIAATRVTYGPYSNPLIQPMRNVSGFEPVHSPHIERSELCATCHTLFTPYVDAQGNIAGEFPEQTPYFEWKHSQYPSQGRGCQSCHMPALQEAIRISSLPQNAPARSPYYQHHFVGGNVQMLSVIKAHADELGITALDEHIDSTSARTLAQLRSGAVELYTEALQIRDTLSVRVHLRNLTGHKFPTGFPSRRAWLHVVIRNRDGALVFESGAPDAQGGIVGVGEQPEPHYDLITRQDEVQVFESIMADTDGNPTVQLLRAARYLKDNRIPPVGFPETLFLDDTVGVIGEARTDGSFGRNASGSDVVEYSIVAEEWNGPYDVVATLYYQSIKPDFIRNIDRHIDQRTQRMRAYWDALPLKHTIIAQADNRSVVIAVDHDNDPVPQLGALWPLPASAATGVVRVPVTLVAPGRLTARIVDPLGRELWRGDYGRQYPGSRELSIPIRGLAAGMYHLHVGVEGQWATRVLPVLP